MGQERTQKAIEEVSRIGYQRTASPDQKTGRFLNGQWYTLVHEEPAATTVPPQAIIQKFQALGLPVHAELEKAMIPGPPRREKVERVREIRHRGPNGIEVKEFTEVVEVERPTTRQVKVWRIYVKIPAWQVDMDWFTSQDNPDWPGEG